MHIVNELLGVTRLRTGLGIQVVKKTVETLYLHHSFSVVVAYAFVIAVLTSEKCDKADFLQLVAVDI